MSPELWKEHLKKWSSTHRGRAMVILMPSDKADMIRVAVISAGGKSTVMDAPSGARTAIVHEVGNGVIIDLVALGSPPMPEPMPPPGPIGDDTIVAATLQVTAAIDVLTTLLQLRAFEV